ncbi:major capsid protein, partial [Proteus mirabilis]
AGARGPPGPPGGSGAGGAGGSERRRGEGGVNFGVLGNIGDESKGKNPDLTQLGTAGNWKKHFTSNKLTAGVMIKLTAEEGK